jgi:hypothetical protein
MRCLKKQIIHDAQQQGEVREGDSALYARVVWALVHGASMLRTYADPDLIRSSVGVLRSGLSLRGLGNPDPDGG